jgi:hypothetical protein
MAIREDVYHIEIKEYIFDGPIVVVIGANNDKSHPDRPRWIYIAAELRAWVGLFLKYMPFVFLLWSAASFMNR